MQPDLKLVLLLFELLPCPVMYALHKNPAEPIRAVGLQYCEPSELCGALQEGEQLSPARKIAVTRLVPRGDDPHNTDGKSLRLFIRVRQFNFI